MSETRSRRLEGMGLVGMFDWYPDSEGNTSGLHGTTGGQCALSPVQPNQTERAIRAFGLQMDCLDISSRLNLRTSLIRKFQADFVLYK